jgi:hypothetical protein
LHPYTNINTIYKASENEKLKKEATLRGQNSEDKESVITQKARETEELHKEKQELIEILERRDSENARLKSKLMFRCCFMIHLSQRMIDE